MSDLYLCLQLADWKMEQEALEEAVPLLTRSLAIKEGAFGPSHGSLVDTLYTLAQATAMLGQMKVATAHIKRTYELALATRGADHPLTAEAKEKYDMMRMM